MVPFPERGTPEHVRWEQMTANDWTDKNTTALYTVEDAAFRMGVSTRTISNWIRSGELLAIPDGRKKLIPLDHLVKVWLVHRGSPKSRIDKPRRDA